MWYPTLLRGRLRVWAGCDCQATGYSMAAKCRKQTLVRGRYIYQSASGTCTLVRWFSLQKYTNIRAGNILFSLKGEGMKKVLALAFMATLALFSLAAIAQVITFNSLDPLEQAETGYYYFEWLLVGSGLLCFMALRREDRTL